MRQVRLAVPLALAIFSCGAQAATCDVAFPVVPCDIGGTVYDTFAGNYSGNRSFYRAASYDPTVASGHLCLAIKSGLSHTDGYAFTPYYGATVWVSPAPYNISFARFGQFGTSCIEQANHFEWFGVGSPNPPPVSLAMTPPVHNGIAHALCPGAAEGHTVTTQWTGSYGGADSARCAGSGGHPGVDIDDVSPGESVFAIAAGTVVVRKSEYKREDGWGVMVVIRHDRVTYGGCLDCTYYSVYAHLASIEGGVPEVGGTVVRDQVLGAIGNTGLGLSGNAGSHLHFQVQATWNEDTNRPYWPTYLSGKKQKAYPSGMCGRDWCDFVHLTSTQRLDAATNAAANTIDPLAFVKSARIAP
jgi:murein DD-endopeptidase MepM/ murein hydrolase activator NlpD